MVAIKTTLKHIPEYCDDCQWYECRPHPYKGWTESCELMMHCMDDDQPEEWIYDGNGRPKACPLIESDVLELNKPYTVGKYIVVTSEDGEMFEVRRRNRK